MIAFMNKKLQNEKQNIRPSNNYIDLSDAHSPQFKRRKSGVVTTTKRIQGSIRYEDKKDR